MLRVQGNPIFIVVLLGSLIVVLLGGLIVVLLGGLLVGLVVVLVVGLQGDLLFGVISIFARLFLGGIQVFVFNVVAGLSKEVGVGRVLEVRSVVEALIVVYRGGDAAEGLCFVVHVRLIKVLVGLSRGMRTLRFIQFLGSQRGSVVVRAAFTAQLLPFPAVPLVINVTVALGARNNCNQKRNAKFLHIDVSSWLNQLYY